jgi:hypothetical protein
MQRPLGAIFAVAFASIPFQWAGAATLPGIKSDAKNRVPECATPGRLMRYLKSRNPELSPRYEGVATEYMRLGEKLGVRWDFAFYQMIIETGSLSYRRGDRAGDVRPAQNNFAGLGATGGGEHGESFKDIPTGIRAHLEHLLLYAGDKLEHPTAERTRKVQEWGVLTDWQARFTRPITFTDLAQQWAPGSNSYPKMLEGIADRFAEFCQQPDPHPELVTEARGLPGKDVVVAKAEISEEKPVGSELARRAIAEGKSEENDRRSALGAPEAEAQPLSFKVLNPSNAEPERTLPPSGPTAKASEPPFKGQEPAAKAGALPGTPATGAAKLPAGEKASQLRTASAATAARAAAPPGPPTAGQKCRVWTASYGGQKALIIRSIVDKVVNYTVLDVNDGAEKREAEAFITAYAKDGAVAGEFPSQTQALDKAFELCPEG